MRLRSLRAFALASAFVLPAALPPFIAPAAARGAPESFADLAANLLPAVVNISSIAGLQGFWHEFAVRQQQVCGQDGRSRSPLELEPLGVQVTCVEPGFFRTEFLSSGSVEYVDAKLAEYESGVNQLRDWLTTVDDWSAAHAIS